MGLGQNELPSIFLMASSCLSTTFSSTSSNWIFYLAATMRFSIFKHSISIFANATSPIKVRFCTPFNVIDLLYSTIFYKVVHSSWVAYDFDRFSLKCLLFEIDFLYPMSLEVQALRFGSTFAKLTTISRKNCKTIKLDVA